MSASGLMAPVDFSELEREFGKDTELAYWMPRRIGEILYNFWD